MAFAHQGAVRCGADETHDEGVDRIMCMGPTIPAPAPTPQKRVYAHIYFQSTGRFAQYNSAVRTLLAVS